MTGPLDALGWLCSVLTFSGAFFLGLLIMVELLTTGQSASGGRPQPQVRTILNIAALTVIAIAGLRGALQ